VDQKVAYKILNKHLIQQSTILNTCPSISRRELQFSFGSISLDLLVTSKKSVHPQ
jgi:hypothetical protein